MPEINLEAEVKLMRGPVTRGLFKAAEAVAETQPTVDREGGKFKAGLIRGISVITRGEALGHRRFIDHETLSQVADRINASGRFGVKSRFAHPELSGDGIGKQAGKAFAGRVEGDQVVADWHALKSAHNAPDGDLAEYVMGMAEEAPEDFGTSIAFDHDREAEEQFMLDNTVELDAIDHRGQPIKTKVFRSPDPLNIMHYPHVRLKELHAVDVVDEPAANPNGLFHRGAFELLENGDAALSYVFGMTEDAPKLSNLGIDPTRLRGFVQRFCQSRGISFTKGQPMADENPTKPADITPPADTKTDVKLNSKPDIVEDEKPDVDVAALSKKTAEEAVAAERRRCADINALCKQSGKTELAAGFIDDGSSVEDVRGKLFSALCNDRPPVGPDAAKPEGEKPKEDENTKYRAEYKAEPRYAAEMTEEAYVAMRRVDDGLDSLQSVKPASK